MTSVKALSVLNSLNRLVATVGKSSHETLSVTGAMAEPILRGRCFHFLVVISSYLIGIHVACGIDICQQECFLENLSTIALIFPINLLMKLFNQEYNRTFVSQANLAEKKTTPLQFYLCS